MIKELSGKDVKILTEFFNDNDYEDGFNERVLTSSFNSGNFKAFCTVINDKIASVVCATFSIDSADIDGVITAKEYRNKGLAKNLISHVSKIAKDMGIGKLFLEVRKNNLPAINLYNGLGFTAISERKAYYPDGETAVVMTREL